MHCLAAKACGGTASGAFLMVIGSVVGKAKVAEPDFAQMSRFIFVKDVERAKPSEKRETLTPDVGPSRPPYNPC